MDVEAIYEYLGARICSEEVYDPKIEIWQVS